MGLLAWLGPQASRPGDWVGPLPPCRVAYHFPAAQAVAVVSGFPRLSWDSDQIAF